MNFYRDGLTVEELQGLLNGYIAQGFPKTARVTLKVEGESGGMVRTTWSP